MSKLYTFLSYTSKYLILPRLFTQGTIKKGTENHLIEILKNRFPKANAVEVEDISGGCGAMYKIFVETPEFKGNSVIKQHKMITDTLKEEIKDMHGLTIQTSIPKTNGS